MGTDPISNRNSKFWDELCGTQIARQLGIADSEPSSLERFDRWFFSFYPYLAEHLVPVITRAHRVLEIGLGYGSVGSRLMVSGLSYTGLDIAEGPVELMNVRANHLGNISCAVVGDVLSMTMFADNSFDGVVAIGSLHHTGDFDRALEEVVRVTKPGGIVVGMVYSLFSLRNWIKRPGLLIRTIRSNRGTHGARVPADENLRWMSDHNSTGVAAPATEYFSRRALRSLLRKYGDSTVTARNLGSIGFFRFVFPRTRLVLLRTPIASIFGLDLYFTLHLNETPREKRP